MPKTADIHLRIDPETKLALEREAQRSERSLSNLIAIILKQWVGTKRKKD